MLNICGKKPLTQSPVEDIPRKRSIKIGVGEAGQIQDSTLMSRSLSFEPPSSPPRRAPPGRRSLTPPEAYSTMGQPYGCTCQQCRKSRFYHAMK